MKALWIGCCVLWWVIGSGPVRAGDLIAVDAADAPFMYETNGQAAGLYPLAIAEAYRRMGTEVTIAAVPWKRALDGADNALNGVAGLYKTEDRLKKYDYSDKLFDEVVMIYVRKGHGFPFATVDDLRPFRRRHPRLELWRRVRHRAARRPVHRRGSCGRRTKLRHSRCGSYRLYSRHRRGGRRRDREPWLARTVRGAGAPVVEEPVLCRVQQIRGQTGGFKAAGCGHRGDARRRQFRPSDPDDDQAGQCHTLTIRGRFCLAA